MVVLVAEPALRRPPPPRHESLQRLEFCLYRFIAGPRYQTSGGILRWNCPDPRERAHSNLEAGVCGFERDVADERAQELGPVFKALVLTPNGVRRGYRGVKR